MFLAYRLTWDPESPLSPNPKEPALVARFEDDRGGMLHGYLEEEAFDRKTAPRSWHVRKFGSHLWEMILRKGEVCGYLAGNGEGLGDTRWFVTEDPEADGITVTSPEVQFLPSDVDCYQSLGTLE